MSIQRKIKQRAQRRALRSRQNLVNSQNLPRVSVFRSLKHIYAQLIDDSAGKTLVSCSSLEHKSFSGSKKSVAHSVGKELAEQAVKKGIAAVVFDRGCFLYHGRVQSLADGLREGGLKV